MDVVTHEKALIKRKLIRDTKGKSCQKKKMVCLDIMVPENRIFNFLTGTNGKLIVLGVPILKHIRVIRLVQ